MSLCFLLTAGQGTRLKPYTDHCAKPTIPLLNLPLAYYGFYLAVKGGFQNFLMNKHHLPEQIEDLATQLRPFARKVETIDETKALLGSGGALWNARDVLKNHDYFLVANGDEVLLPQDETILSELFHHCKTTQSLCTLLTCDHPELLKSLKPVWVNSKGMVKGFGMTAPKESLQPVHYTGYKVFSKKILDWLPEGESNIFYEVVTEAIKKGEHVSHLHLPKAIWFETGNPAAFATASEELQKNHITRMKERFEFFNIPMPSHFEAAQEVLKSLCQ